MESSSFKGESKKGEMYYVCLLYFHNKYYVNLHKCNVVREDCSTTSKLYKRYPGYIVFSHSCKKVKSMVTYKEDTEAGW